MKEVKLSRVDTLRINDLTRRFLDKADRMERKEHESEEYIAGWTDAIVEFHACIKDWYEIQYGKTDTIWR